MSYQNVLVLKDLAENKPLKAPVGDTDILLIRQGDEVKAYQSECPHSGAPLEEGAIYQGTLTCPWHKATFSLLDGALCEPLALSDLKRYPVRVENGMIQVDPQPMPPLATFSAGDSKPVFVILGTGAAGSAAAWTLRREGFDGRLVLVDRESEAPYDRTALTKFVPSGKMKISEVPAMLDDDFFQYAERLQGNVEQLDSRQQLLRFADGSTLQYDKLLLASGGVPQRPDIPGNALAGVHVLRSIEQCAAVMKAVEQQRKLVIIGNSFIGMELASALRAQDIAVQIVAPQPLPFKAQFGEQLARFFRDLHQQNGVEFITDEVAELTAENGHVSGVRLKSGQQIASSVVVLATGVTPGCGFIHDIALQDDGSLATDEALQAAKNVWAAGDIASYPAEEGLQRIEHWRVAQQQGRIAAKNMLGAGEAFDRVPFFWTAQFGTRYEYLGHAEKWDEERLIGSLSDKMFVMLYGQKGKLAAVASCGCYTFTAELVQRMQQPMTLDAAEQLSRAHLSA
ncbi:Rhodocoxin reductase [Erwinia aphidicola]|uniref:FAD-dependent oxidoreductase n=1 Tax=Erwinia aphidicola TaxID=68334 RepID=UPI001D4F8244|nr:FAD-dependent oxidoreductase [Erwinia aphidicola]CAH0282179.1 Rhodocoxin reductase [Erwinia aphidicola]